MWKYLLLGAAVVIGATAVGVVQVQRQRLLQEGAELATLYCASCHLEPEPDMLPKRSWETVLGYMGYWLGIEDISFLDDAPEFARENVANRHEALLREGVFPDAPLLNEEDWASLRGYYVTNAPATALPQTGKPTLNWELPRFDIFRTSYLPEPVGVTTLVHIREETG